MANKKITELNEATSVSNNDWLVIVDVANDETKKVHASEVGGNIPIQDTAPQNPEEDDLWIDTSENDRLKYFNGTSWVGVSDNITGDTLPIGSQIPYGSTTAPANWLVCDGSYVSKTTYSELYAVIGDSYLDGGTAPEGTFRLPNKKGRNSVGYDSEDTDFNTIGKKGGSKYLQAHSHKSKNNTKFLTNTYPTISQVNYATGSGSDYYDYDHYNETDIAGTGDSGNLSPYEVDCWIIKAKQSAGLVANVSNTQSQSTTDTYSCDYINNSIIELKPYVLFSGSTTGTITLNDSAANYTFLEIYYEGASNFHSTKIYNPNNKQAFLISGWLNTNTQGNIKFAIIRISGTSITKIKTTALNYDTSYANASEENGLSITTVIGYK